MLILRAISLWLLVLAVPVQTWAAAAMTHCKDVPVQAAASQPPAPHDHAAMLRQMASADSQDRAGHAHHAMADEAGNADQDVSTATATGTNGSPLGCDCGCDCSGNCVMTCAASVVSLSGSTAHTSFDAAKLYAVSVPSQAQPAHRFTLLRPPSAAAS